MRSRTLRSMWLLCSIYFFNFISQIHEFVNTSYLSVVQLSSFSYWKRLYSLKNNNKQYSHRLTFASFHSNVQNSSRNVIGINIRLQNNFFDIKIQRDNTPSRLQQDVSIYLEKYKIPSHITQKQYPSDGRHVQQLFKKVNDTEHP